MSTKDTVAEKLAKLGTREYEAVNEKHISDPQPGDYWHEMFCPYLVVLGRSGRYIVVCETRKSVDAGHWTWDMEKIAFKTLTELRNTVTYGTIPGFVADVAPGVHIEFAEEWKRMTP